MKKFLIADLTRIIKATLEYDTSHEPRVISHCFNGVSIDSRTTQPGNCFFAIPGENFDGHDYVVDAFAKGAVCAVVSKKVATAQHADKVLMVEDTIKALGDFARHYRRQANFKVVAITGSVGKTTTRQIAHHVLSQRYRCCQAPKNFNNYIGLPLTLLGAELEHQIVIAELGSSHPGEIAYLTQIAQPDIAVITNVHPAHLAGFGSLQAIIQEKLSISEGLQRDGILIINADIMLPPSEPTHQVITFGKSERCDIKAENIELADSASRFTIDRIPVYLPLPGKGNLENALAAWAICKQFSFTADDFADAVKTVPAVPMRSELLQIGTLTVLNDCYNANPASMKNALDIFTGLDSTGNRRLVFICGSMAELGRQSKKLHAELGISIARAKVRLLLAVGEFAKAVVDAAKANAKYDLQTECFEDAISACNNLQKFIKNYDIILVKGSRTAKLELAVEKLKQLFS